jgi:phosphomannomutase
MLLPLLVDKQYGEALALLYQLAYLRHLPKIKQGQLLDELITSGYADLAARLSENLSKTLDETLSALEEESEDLFRYRKELLDYISKRDNILSITRALKIGTESEDIDNRIIEHIAADSELLGIILELREATLLDGRRWTEDKVNLLRGLLYLLKQIEGVDINVLRLPDGRHYAYNKYILRKRAIEAGLRLAVTPQGLEHLIKLGLTHEKGLFYELLTKEALPKATRQLIDSGSQVLLEMARAGRRLTIWDGQRMVLRGTEFCQRLIELKRPQVETVYLATMDRPEALKREIEIELENHRIFNRKIPLVVIDDSREEILKVNKKRIASLRSDYGAVIVHLTGEDREAYQSEIARKLTLSFQRDLGKGRLHPGLKSLLRDNKILVDKRVVPEKMKEYMKSNVFKHISGVRNFTVLIGKGERAIMNIDDDAPPETYVFHRKDKDGVKGRDTRWRERQKRKDRLIKELIGKIEDRCLLKIEDEKQLYEEWPSREEKLRDLEEEYFDFSEDGRKGLIPQAMDEILSLERLYIDKELKALRITHQRYQSLMEPLPEYAIRISDFIYERPRITKKQDKFQILPVNTVRATSLIGKRVKQTYLPYVERDLRGTQALMVMDKKRLKQKANEEIYYIAYPFILDQDTSGVAQFMRYLEMKDKVYKNLQHTDQAALILDGVDGFIADTYVIFNRATLQNKYPFPSIGRDLRLEEPPYIVWVARPLLKDKICMGFSPVAGGQERDIGEREYVISYQDFTEITGGLARKFYEQAVSRYYKQLGRTKGLRLKDRFRLLGSSYIEVGKGFRLEEEDKTRLLRERRMRLLLASDLGIQRGEKENPLRETITQEARDMDLVLLQYTADFFAYKPKDRIPGKLRLEDDYSPKTEGDYFYLIERRANRLHWKKVVPQMELAKPEYRILATKSRWISIEGEGNIGLSGWKSGIPLEIEPQREIVLKRLPEEGKQAVVPAIRRDLEAEFLKGTKQKVGDQIIKDGEAILIWPDVVKYAKHWKKITATGNALDGGRQENNVKQRPSLPFLEKARRYGLEIRFIQSIYQPGQYYPEVEDPKWLTENDPEMVNPDTDESDSQWRIGIYGDMFKTKKGDKIFNKTNQDPFSKEASALEEWLEDTEYVLIAGFTTDGCVKEAVNALSERGYTPIVLKNCVATSGHKIKTAHPKTLEEFKAQDIEVTNSKEINFEKDKETRILLTLQGWFEKVIAESEELRRLIDYIAGTIREIRDAFDKRGKRGSGGDSDGGKLKQLDLANVYVLILAGGGGTRAWPWSTSTLPKQLLRLFGTEKNLVQESVIRALHKLPAGQIFIQTIPDLKEQMIKAVAEFGIPSENVFCEPAMADTAAANGYGVVRLYRQNPDSVVIVLTADHKIKPVEKFWESLDSCITAAQSGPNIVCIGVTPNRNATGFGYQEPGKEIKGLPGIKFVKKFVEKPPYSERPKTREEMLEKHIKAGYTPETLPSDFIACELIDNMHCHWNSGMFIFKAKTLLECYQVLSSAYYKGLRQMLDADEASFDSVAEEAFRTFVKYKKEGLKKKGPVKKGDSEYVIEAGKNSIDFIIMEPLSKGKSPSHKIVSFFDTGFFWEDVGDLGPGVRVANQELIDEKGNLIFNHNRASLGLTDTQGSNILIQEGSSIRKVVIKGAKDLLVAIGSFANSVVVMPLSETQEIKAVQKELKKESIYLPYVQGTVDETTQKGLIFSYESEEDVNLFSNQGLVVAAFMKDVTVIWKGKTLKVLAGEYQKEQHSISAKSEEQKTQVDEIIGRDGGSNPKQASADRLLLEGVRLMEEGRINEAGVDFKKAGDIYKGLQQLLAFLKKIPIELGFGTSGLRDLIENMTDMECYINTRGFIEYLITIGDIRRGNIICVAGDRRSSTPRIMTAVAKAIVDSGCKIENCGLIPSPALAYYAMQKGRASAMVTGSHIPEDRNGIKFNKSMGEVLKSDEAGILAFVAKVRMQEYAKAAQESLFDENAMFKEPVSLGPVNKEAEAFYIRRYTDVFPKDALKGKTVVVYQHSAVGRDILVEILRDHLGAEVIPVKRSDGFVAIDTESITLEDLVLFRKLAGKYKDIFAIISTDGDSDRPFVVDEKGKFHRGDVLGIVVAEYLKAGFVAIPISSNDAVQMQLETDKTPFKFTRIGSPYVIAAMNEAETRCFQNVVSWEVNGGFLTGTDLKLNNKTLKALPTRDAFLPIICALLSATAQNTSVSELFKILPPRYTQAEKIKFSMQMSEFREMSSSIIKAISPKDANINYVYFNKEEITIIYKDGTRRMVAKEESLGKELLDMRNAIENYLVPKGFKKVKTIIYVDGVRIILENQDIIHFRPSGNAPEFRCYSCADTQKRADEIVEFGIAEPDGILRQMGESLKKKSDSSLDRHDGGKSSHRATEMVAIQAYRRSPAPLVICCKAMDYAWGDKDYIPALLRVDNSVGKPYAEL